MPTLGEDSDGGVDVRSRGLPEIQPSKMDCPSMMPQPASGPMKERLVRLCNQFVTKFDRQPQFFVRVPGRVNLIGEHIDYCGYGVFPMAIEKDIVLAVGPDETTVRQLSLTNLNEQYPDYTTSLDQIQIDGSVPHWYKYFLCGVKGVLEHFETTVPVSFNVAVDGAIPPSAGLSSSSALVCAAALSTVTANKLCMSKHELATLCAKAERHIGTQGGGMDQAIAFLANPGTAKLIEFNPLRATNVCLPEGAVFVVVNSLAEMNKAASADFNCRVMECRLAAQIIAKQRGLDWRTVMRLGDLQTTIEATLSDMIALVKKTLHENEYAQREICTILNITEDELKENMLSPNTKHIQKFKLYQRALHVFQEASRVQEFRQICEDEEGANVLEKLGTLMNSSHASLRDLYECSHSALDRLVELSSKVAYGARLTGAGWGGCIVALVPADKVQSYIQLMEAEYFEGLQGPSTYNITTAAFATQPGAGACLFQS